MKKLLSIATALVISLASFAGGGEKYNVDSKVSKMEWVGKKVTGQHNGTITVDGGEVTVEDGMITGGTLYIDMNSIVVLDIEDEGTNAKLSGHLRSDDFFGVEKHPKSKLVITKVEKKGDIYHIHGDLTIKGITQKVEIPAKITMEDGKLVAIGETEIDRTKFDIRYGSGKFFEGLGDKMIYDTFTVKFKVGAKKS
ncbi:MAG: lipid-binding protein [Flavobacteriales bacterium]|nr:lipid-binding protein [Flavobacteriales bacterium]|tara:strand:- start:33 stop:620 length:588 start_codon:yes stop_codon:yes gene_type:complete